MATALRNFEVSRPTNTSLQSVMTRPPCLRLYPAYPGNPRSSIEGESPRSGKDIRSALMRATGCCASFRAGGMRTAGGGEHCGRCGTEKGSLIVRVDHEYDRKRREHAI